MNDTPLVGLLLFIMLINLWHTRILFLISGMSVRFAVERRNWKQLLGDRTVRILLPLAVVYFVLSHILNYLFATYYGEVFIWKLPPGHL